MLARIFWFTTIFGYIIQTKCISHIQSAKVALLDVAAQTASASSAVAVATASATATAAASAVTGSSGSNDDDSLTLFLTFLHFASWLTLLPVAHAFKDKEDIKEEESSSAGKFKYLLKLITMAVLIILPVFTYNLALSLTPAFDVSLMQNTAIFEIVILLYGISAIARRQHVFRNFLIMMVALLGILIVAYTKATCDLLAGKLSINKDTGELNDPFLFDRLKGSLIVGLGALPMGPFAVLYHKWFASANTVRQATHLSLIATVAMCILLPFLVSQAATTSSQSLLILQSAKTFWLPLLGSILFGTLPNLISLLYLNKNIIPEYTTTCNLGIIIMMGLVEWIAEPTQTTVVRWEVIGYLMLSVSCVLLSSIFFEKKTFTHYF